MLLILVLFCGKYDAPAQGMVIRNIGCNNCIGGCNDYQSMVEDFCSSNIYGGPAWRIIQQGVILQHCSNISFHCGTDTITLADVCTTLSECTYTNASCMWVSIGNILYIHT